MLVIATSNYKSHGGTHSNEACKRLTNRIGPPKISAIYPRAWPGGACARFSLHQLVPTVPQMQAVEVGTLKAQKHLFLRPVGSRSLDDLFGRLGGRRSCGQFGKVNSLEAWDFLGGADSKVLGFRGAPRNPSTENVQSKQFNPEFCWVNWAKLGACFLRTLPFHSKSS